MKKKILAIILVFVLTLQCVQIVFGSIKNDAEQIKIKDYVVEDFITNQVGEYEITKEISKNNLQRCIKEFRDKGETDEKIYRNILSGLGYSEETLDIMEQEDINELVDDMESITVTNKFYHLNASGEAVECTEEEYQLEKERQDKLTLESLVNSNVIKENQLENSFTLDRYNGNGGYNSEVTNDNYLKITTTASYVPPYKIDNENGHYVVRGDFLWAKIPDTKYVDAISLGANDLQWSDKLSEYESKLHYAYTDGGKRKEENKDLNIYKQRDGVYSSFQYPLFNVTGLSVYIKGRVRVKNYSFPYATSIYSCYEHSCEKLKLNAAFEWEFGEFPKVTFNPKFEIKHTGYLSYCNIDYDPGNTK